MSQKDVEKSSPPLYKLGEKDYYFAMREQDVNPGAVTSKSKNVAATQEFLDWCLSSDKAQEIWQKWGFELA